MRILLVDDHQLLCTALSAHIEQLSSEMSANSVQVTPVFTLAAALQQVQSETPPDIVFLDLDLDPSNHGAATLRNFQSGNGNGVPVVIFTGRSPEDPDSVEVFRECLGVLHARGILLKRADIDSTFVGLKRLLAGEKWWPQEVLMALVTSPSRKPSNPNLHLGLSKREWDVARCLTRGLQDKQIAIELNISPNYIRQVTSQIYEKLDVSTRTQAAMVVRASPEYQDAARVS